MIQYNPEWDRGTYLTASLLAFGMWVLLKWIDSSLFTVWLLWIAAYYLVRTLFMRKD